LVTASYTDFTIEAFDSVGHTQGSEGPQNNSVFWTLDKLYQDSRGYRSTQKVEERWHKDIRGGLKGTPLDTQITKLIIIVCRAHWSILYYDINCKLLMHVQTQERMIQVLPISAAHVCKPTSKACFNPFTADPVKALHFAILV